MTITEIRDDMARMLSELDAIRNGGKPSDYFIERKRQQDEDGLNDKMIMAIHKDMMENFERKVRLARKHAAKGTQARLA